MSLLWIVVQMQNCVLRSTGAMHHVQVRAVMYLADRHDNASKKERILLKSHPSVCAVREIISTMVSAVGSAIVIWQRIPASHVMILSMR